MLARLRGLFKRDKEPAFDWSRLPAVLDMAAAARPVRLVEVLTYAQAEAMAGGLGEPWTRLTALLLPGDALWRFNSPAEAWQAKAGRSGVVLVRAGAAVCHVVTVLN